MNEDFDKETRRLSEALKSWKVESGLPPNFQERVWRRIEREETARQTTTLWAIFQSWLEAALSHRAVAVSYIAALLAIGLIAGYETGERQARRMDNGLGLRYLQTVDPYQASPAQK